MPCDNVPAVLWVGLGTAFFTCTNALAHNGRFVDCSVPDRDFQTQQEPGEAILFLRLEVTFFLHSSFYPVCWAN